MDDDEISEPSSEKKTYAEAFDEAYPYFMTIGMTYDEFWNQDPFLAVYCLKSHELKRDEENQKLWLNGLYTFIAVSTALSNIHFDGKKHKINHYLKEPIRIRPYTEEELKAIQERNTAVTVATLNALKDRFDSMKNEEQTDAG